MYRPLNNNETVVVNRVLYGERGLNEGAAASLFMIYKAQAMRDDVPEYQVFEDSEKERLASRLGTANSPRLSDSRSPDEVFEALEAASAAGGEAGVPKSLLEWFWGDEAALGTKYKRLKVLFFNSGRYRAQLLQFAVQEGILKHEDLDNLDTIHQVLVEHYQKYPGTRQGVISNYDLYFGDSTGFSYDMVKARERFHADEQVRRGFLTFYHLPLNWTVEDIRQHLQKS